MLFSLLLPPFLLEKFTLDLLHSLTTSYGLDDTGPMIIQLMICQLSIIFAFCQKNSGHISRMLGNIHMLANMLQLDHPLKRIPMRYTLSLPITVVNFTKFRDPLKCIESEFTSFLH